ncbi:MAG: site-2 protease family protein [Candidatus Eisenbacteria bacterium]|nr:site-2 protease family protein [Candidatus Eisenbacteria bacterium]
MRWSLTLGRIAGIRVEIHVTFLLFVGLIAVQNGLLKGRLHEALIAVGLMLMAFGCVVLHEFGHALMARRFGIRTLDIVLLPIGGVARLQRMPERPQQEIAVALAGPAVNLAIVATLLLTRAVQWPVDPETITHRAPEFLLFVNVVMLLFNLIPAFPMDGGRVLRAALALKLPFARATRIATRVGQVVAVLFGLAGWRLNQPMLIFVALFVFIAAGEERALVQQRGSLAGLLVRAAMMTQFDALGARDPLRRAMDLLLAGSQQDFPVLDGGALVGILSRGDLIRALQNGGIDHPVEGWMAHDVPAADPGEPLEDALSRMRSRGRNALPVVDGGKLIGLLTLENVGDLVLVHGALRGARSRG